MCAISCRPSSSSHRRPLLRLLVCRDRAIGATLGARGGGANMGELLKHKQRTHTPENHVRGLPGLRLRPPSCAPGSVGMTRGGVGVCEVAGRLNRGFYNDCEKSPPQSPALNVVAMAPKGSGPPARQAPPPAVFIWQCVKCEYSHRARGGWPSL